MTIKKRHLIAAAYLYMVLPILIFFLTWLKIPLALLFTGVLLCGFFMTLKSYGCNFDDIYISLQNILKIVVVVFLFVYLSGQGGFFFQYHDNHWRNAVYRDLIQFDWPVIYPETGNALVYYIMHWIFPAYLSKLFSLTGESTFWIARILLFAWTYLGVLIVIILLVNYFGSGKSGNINIILAVFMGWSGINVLGGIIYNALGLTDFSLNTYLWWTNFSLDNQPYAYMYRSNMDQLASTYNQTIAPWIAAILFLDSRKISDFAFLGLCVLPYAPLPFLGLFMILVIYAIPELLQKGKKHEYKEIFKSIFSFQNVSALTILVVFFFYFKCNVAYAAGEKLSGSILYVPLSQYGVFRIFTLLLFYVLFFGAYALLIYKHYCKNYLFKIVVGLLIIIPFFRIGVLADFCWNVSVVPYFILMIFVMEYLIYYSDIKNCITKQMLGLCMCLTLSYLNPISQVAFGMKIALQEKTVLLMTDNVKTFSNKDVYDVNVEYTYNFLTPDPDKQIFYKYFAK